MNLDGATKWYLTRTLPMSGWAILKGLCCRVLHHLWTVAVEELSYKKKTKLGFSLRVSDADKNFDFLSLINLTIYLLMQYMFDWCIYVNSSAFRHQINNPQNKVDIHLVSWQLPHPNSLKWHKIQTKFSTADRQFAQFALKNLYPFYWAKFLKKSLEHIQTYKYTLFWGRKCPDCPKE